MDLNDPHAHEQGPTANPAVDHDVQTSVRIKIDPVTGEALGVERPTDGFPADEDEGGA